MFWGHGHISDLFYYCVISTWFAGFMENVSYCKPWSYALTGTLVGSNFSISP